MAKEQNLAHTKWLCKYHIVFTPKYRRKAIYGQYREEIGQIIRQLCNYKGIEIVEGHMMPDHVHMLVMIPPEIFGVVCDGLHKREKFSYDIRSIFPTKI